MDATMLWPVETLEPVELAQESENDVNEQDQMEMLLLIEWAAQLESEAKA